jgi:DNA-binding NtrC family response regulator
MSMSDTNFRVLMVDDEVDFLESTARALSRRGFDLTTARDGQTALRVLEQTSFDVAVLDIKMPGLQGDELFRHIHKRWPGLPVILLTGHGTVQQAFQTSKQGVFEYLTKPCEIEELARMLRRAASLIGRRPGTAEARPPEQDAASLDQIRLLLVDDEPEFVHSLSASLRRRGIATATALSGEEAVKLLDRQLFDVAVIDLKMPGMDGLTLLERIQQAQPAAEVLLLTGHPTVGTVRKALNQGAFDYVLKPHDMSELLHKIQLAFERSRQAALQKQQEQVEQILEDKPD